MIDTIFDRLCNHVTAFIPCKHRLSQGGGGTLAARALSRAKSETFGPNLVG